MSGQSCQTARSSRHAPCSRLGLMWLRVRHSRVGERVARFVHRPDGFARLFQSALEFLRGLLLLAVIVEVYAFLHGGDLKAGLAALIGLIAAKDEVFGPSVVLQPCRACTDRGTLKDSRGGESR